VLEVQIPDPIPIGSEFAFEQKNPGLKHEVVVFSTSLPFKLEYKLKEGSYLYLSWTLRYIYIYIYIYIYTHTHTHIYVIKN
jgi:hypothetical protein